VRDELLNETMFKTLSHAPGGITECLILFDYGQFGNNKSFFEEEND
jgi:hypothetical protein